MTKALLPVLFLTAFAAALAQAQVYAPAANPGAERDLYMEAENRFLNHDYEIALDRFESFIRQYPLSQYVPDAQFRRAVSLYRLGRYANALDLFIRIEERYRSTRYLAAVPFWKGVVEYYLGRYGPAVADLDRYLAASASDQPVRRQALLYKGVSEVAAGKGGDAIRSLESLMNGVIAPSAESYGLTLLCSLYRDAKMWPKIIALYERTDVAQVDARWKPQFELYAAEAYYATGDRKAAASIYHTLEKANADVATVAFERLFELSRENGDQAEQNRILAAAETALAGRSDVLSQFWLRVGIESYQQKRYDVAELYFQRLWDLRGSEHLPGTVPLYLADIYLMRNRNQQALGVLRSYLDEPWVKASATAGAANSAPPAAEGPVPMPKPALPGTSSAPTAAAVETYRDRVLARTGGIYLSSGEWQKAQAIFETVISAYPDSPVFPAASYQRAYALYRQGDYKGALEGLKSLFASGNSGDVTADALRLQASCEEKMGDLSSAIDTLRQYVALSRNDLAARADLVRMLFEDKRYERVVSDGSAVFSDFPDLASTHGETTAQLHYVIGLSYVVTKDYHKAIEQLTAAGGPSSQSAVYPYKLYYLGWSYYRLGEFDKAVGSYDELVTGYPSNPMVPQAAYLAGWSAYSTGKYGEAEHYLRLAVSYDQSQKLTTEAAFLLGQSLAEQKKYQQAQAQFHDVFTAYPDSNLADDAMYEYARSFEQLNMIDNAASAYRNLADRYPDSPLAPEALYRRGQLYYNAGRYTDAQEAYFLYRSTYPSGTQLDGALYWGGMASLKANQPSGALLLWERLIAERRDSSFRSDAMYRAAGIYEARGDYKNALNLYSEFLARYPQQAAAVDAQKKVDALVLQMNGLTGEEASLLVTIDSNGRAATKSGRAAILKLAHIVIYQESPSSSNQQLVLPLLRQVADHRKDDAPSAADAQFLLAEIAARQSDYLQAANGFLDSAATDPSDRSHAGRSLYRAAEMLKLAGKPAQLKELVNRIADTFPNTQWAAEARKLLEQ